MDHEIDIWNYLIFDTSFFLVWLLLYVAILNKQFDVDGLVQKDVTPLLTHWSYFFLALTHRCKND